MNIIQHCFVCRPSYSTVSEDAGLEPMTVATLALTARRYNHLTRSHPQRGGKYRVKVYFVYFHKVTVPFCVVEMSEGRQQGAKTQEGLPAVLWDMHHRIRISEKYRQA
jgi:hypothetical protein